MRNRTAQKDTIKDIISDSQVNSYFPYRWSSASLTLNVRFYLFLYLYITRITINNGTSHLKSPRNQKRRAANKITGGFNYFAVDQLSPLVLPWFIRQNSYNESITLQNKNKPFKITKHLFFLNFHYKARQRAIRAALQADHKQIDKKHEEPHQKYRLGTASNEINGRLQLVCGRPTLTLSSASVPQTFSSSVCVEDS